MSRPSARPRRSSRLSAQYATPRNTNVSTTTLIKRLGVTDEFVEHGPQDILRARYGLSPAGIFEAALALVDQKKKGQSGTAEIKG